MLSLTQHQLGAPAVRFHAPDNLRPAPGSLRAQLLADPDVRYHLDRAVDELVALTRLSFPVRCVHRAQTVLEVALQRLPALTDAHLLFHESWRP